MTGGGLATNDVNAWQAKVIRLFDLARTSVGAEFAEALEDFVECLNASGSTGEDQGSGGGEDCTKGEALLQTRDAEKHTCAHVAAFHGNMRVLEYIYSLCPEVCVSPDKQGEGPLFAAVNNGQRRVVEWLLSVGADKYALNQVNLTPIHAAMRLQDGGQILKVLTKSLEPRPGLYAFGAVTGGLLSWCVLTNNIELFKTIIDVSDPKQLAKDCMESPLPCAVVGSARPETAGVVLQYLIDKHVAPEAIAAAHDQTGCSVLCNLAQLEDHTFLEKLMGGCSDECLRDLCSQRSEGRTPWLYAKTEAAKELLGKFTDDAARIPDDPETSGDHVAPSGHANNDSNQPGSQTGGDSDPTGGENKMVMPRKEVDAATMAACEKLKLLGNKKFTEHSYVEAEAAFREALGLMSVDIAAVAEQTGLLNPSCVDKGTITLPVISQSEDYIALASTLVANLSVASLRLGKHRDAEECAAVAIAFAPEWYKGYYRLAMAKKVQGDYAEATQQMYLCIMRNSQDEALRKEFNNCLELAKAQHKRQQ
ncbi:ankyrin repeat protein [Gregarina niphandrodes]|uniref:Ankyrin repeat protein n=1 Tax=Gregarina niphandrodes TaxID=110365 RepID=A0A023B5R0_GRENI|nr:ankyrin repeat protein [Gregarina niphandrodes]EZG61535.1 ankyrin repeat protein [Gregarina niphandrodes]|eukprot:XP_011130741.1 ankyrin repeat protein [Gregarina niphandrodes]